MKTPDALTSAARLLVAEDPAQVTIKRFTVLREISIQDDMTGVTIQARYEQHVVDENGDTLAMRPQPTGIYALADLPPEVKEAIAVITAALTTPKK